MPPETTLEYLNKNGYTEGDITRRFHKLLHSLQNYKIVKKIVRTTTIDTEALKNAIIDYYVDTVRIKEFHNISYTRTEKIYGYMAYWLLKRKPIKTINNFEGSIFINERFVAAYLISNMFAEKSLSYGKINNKAALDEYSELLIYNLKYRQVTQQSLELMIKAFYAGYDIKC